MTVAALPPFVARASELDSLARAFAARPALVLIDGPAGIGKTALGDHFAATAGARVLRASGERVEADLPYALVDQLLRRAGRPGVPPASDPAQVGERLLELLAHPAVLVLDDAQWADAASVAALVFAWRRQVNAPVLALVLTRAAEAPALEPLRRAAALELRVGALTLEAFERRFALTGSAARRLWQHVDGNPGEAEALLRELPPKAWTDPDAHLPAPAMAAAAMRRWLDGCSRDARRLMEAIVVLGGTCRLGDAAAIAGVERAPEALEEAIDAGWLTVDPLRGFPVVSFRRRLDATAAYAQLRPVSLVELHRAAAARAGDRAAALQHLALAASGPDDALATQLDAFGGAGERRPDAAAALLAASRLSSTREAREDRVLRAVDWMLLAGDTARARGFAPEVEACRPAARRDSVLAQLAMADGRAGEAADALASAWEQCDEAGEAELAATIAHRRAFHALVHLRDDEVIKWARRAIELAPDDPLAVEWTATLGLATWRRGHRLEADELLTAALRHDPERDAQLIGMRAWLRYCAGDADRARGELAAAAATELRLGAREIAVVHLNVLARAHFSAGDWDAAASVADEAVALASEMEDVSARCFVWWAAALAPSARGDFATADALAARAGQEPRDAPDRHVAVGVAQAWPAAARGDWPAVLAALAPVVAIHSTALDEPGFWPWQHLQAHALLALGHVEEASAFLVPHEEIAAAREQRQIVARLAAIRGMIEGARGDVACAELAFERALAHADAALWPYDAAHVQLAHGAFLRRAGRRRAAVEALGTASAAFAALGARPALERCERELTASGLHPSRRRGRAGHELTPQERAVAALVAAGGSNREIAAELQVSVKTVEVHLTRIYAKLEIGSRTQLVARLHPNTSGA